MSRVKTFDATGIAPGGRLFAGDLNSIQDQYSDLSNFSQTHDVGTLRIGDTSIQLLKYGTAEARLSAALRTDGILRGLGGLFGGQFTNAASVPVGFRPFGIIVFDLSQNRYIMNVGTDASPTWLTMTTSSEIAAVAPLGSILDYGGSADPNANWMLCDGRSLLRAGTYAALFSLISTTFGSVDGTHFNIPDFRGRTAVMVDGAAARLAGPDTLGASSGEENHTLTAAEMPVHNHGGATGNVSAGHTHTMSHDHALQMSIAAPVSSSPPPMGGAGSVFDAGGGGAGTPVKTFNGSTGGQSADHTHTIPNAGSGSAHNVMQPYLVANKIIRVV